MYPDRPGQCPAPAEQTQQAGLLICTGSNNNIYIDQAVCANVQCVRSCLVRPAKTKVCTVLCTVLPRYHLATSAIAPSTQQVPGEPSL